MRAAAQSFSLRFRGRMPGRACRLMSGRGARQFCGIYASASSGTAPVARAQAAGADDYSYRLQRSRALRS